MTQFSINRAPKCRTHTASKGNLANLHPALEKSHGLQYCSPRMSDSSTDAEAPDPRFASFVYFQAQNGGLFLGRIPNPANGETSVNIRAARSVVDSLEMLRDKTTGNLNQAEQNLLKLAVENLRKLYDEVVADHPVQESDHL